jgi:hypothetical protein
VKHCTYFLLFVFEILQKLVDVTCCKRLGSYYIVLVNLKKCFPCLSASNDLKTLSGGSLKVLSSENQQGSKLGSNDRYWFSVVVLDIIFNF